MSKVKEKTFSIEYGQGPADEHGVTMQGLATYFIDGLPVKKEEFERQYAEYRKTQGWNV